MATSYYRDEVFAKSALLTTMAATRLTPHGVVAGVMGTLALALAILSIFVGYFIPPEAMMFLSTVLALALVLTFLYFPLGRRSWADPYDWRFAVDLVLVVAAVLCRVYIGQDIEAFQARWGSPSDLDVLVGTVEILLVLEATRRAVSWMLVVVVVAFVAYPLVANYMPGLLYGPPAEWRFVISLIFMQAHGIFGLPLTVIASYVILFVIFGAILQRSGAGAFFINLALATTGAQTGGPAKAAVISSALFGTLSGSAVANVVTTGTFTIPLMRRVGYANYFAGAVEAVASTGGQIMPPVMGAVAFVMAAFMGVPYADVAIAAAIPAILYYASLFWQVHFEAKRLGLTRIPRRELPNIRSVLARGWHLALPLVAIVALILMGRSVAQMGFVALVSALVISFVRRETRLTPVNLLLGLEDAIRAAVPVLITCAAVGMIIGSIYSTGVHFRISSLVLELAGGQLWLVLLLTMAVLLFLGMGMGTVAEYLAVAALIVPGIIKLGVPAIAAHMFALYYAVIGAITPPVAIAAYAAAGLAGSPPFRTGWVACRLALVGFIVPWMFVFSPELLFRGAPADIALAFVTANVGVFALAASLEGYLLRPAKPIERVALAAGALLLIKPGLATDVVGIALVGSAILAQRVWPERARVAAQAAAPVAEPAPIVAEAAQGAGLPMRAAPAPVARGPWFWVQWVALATVAILLFWLGEASFHLQETNAFVVFLLIIGTALIGLARLGLATAERVPGSLPTTAGTQLG